jgi:hypothetical protein
MSLQDVDWNAAAAGVQADVESTLLPEHQTLGLGFTQADLQGGYSFIGANCPAEEESSESSGPSSGPASEEQQWSEPEVERSAGSMDAAAAPVPVGAMPKSFTPAPQPPPDGTPAPPARPN